MRKILAFAEEYSLCLILGIAIALIWANLDPGGYHHFVERPLFGTAFTVHFLVKDVFMALFFAIAAVEIVVAVRPGGDLHPLKKAVNPLLATAGGVLGPVAVYFLLATLCHQQAFASGWGIVTATDIAIAWLGAKLIFGRNHPAVKYLLLLAVADDAVGLAIIAVAYPETTVTYAYLLLCLLGMVIALGLRKAKVKPYGLYLLLAGVPSWCGLYLAHIEPALALVLIVPFLPSAYGKEKEAASYVDDNALERFYRVFKPVVDYGLFFFGLVNAGVLFADMGFVTVLVAVSLIVGKTLGIFSFGLLGKNLGFSLPAAMTGRELFVVAVVAGVGLTVSLFICQVAFTDSATVGTAKMGALLSAVSLPLAILAARLLGVTKERNIDPQRKASS